VPKQTTSPADETAGAGPGAGLETLSYEQARDELVAVVSRLESGAESLEESLALWERGEALAARCQQWLDGARERLAAARGEAAGEGPGVRGDAGAQPPGGADEGGRQ